MSADEFANPMVVIGVEIAQSPGSSVAEMIELNEVAISDDELADLTDAFQAADTGGDGALSLDEFHWMLEVMGCELDEEQTRKLAAEAKANFAAWLKTSDDSHMDECRKAWDAFDANQDGKLDVHELNGVIKHLQAQGFSPKVLAKADLADGSLDFGEFSTWFIAQENGKKFKVPSQSHFGFRKISTSTLKRGVSKGLPSVGKGVAGAAGTVFEHSTKIVARSHAEASDGGALSEIKIAFGSAKLMHAAMDNPDQLIFGEYVFMIRGNMLADYLAENTGWRTKIDNMVKLREAFGSADIDGNNELQQSEFEFVMMSMHPTANLSKDDIQRFWDVLCPEGQVTINFAEFVKGMVEAEKITDLRSMFSIDMPNRFELLSLIVDSPINRAASELLHDRMNPLEKIGVGILRSVEIAAQTASHNELKHKQDSALETLQKDLDEVGKGAQDGDGVSEAISLILTKVEASNAHNLADLKQSQAEALKGKVLEACEGRLHVLNDKQRGAVTKLHYGCVFQAALIGAVFTILPGLWENFLVYHFETDGMIDAYWTCPYEKRGQGGREEYDIDDPEWMGARLEEPFASYDGLIVCPYGTCTSIPANAVDVANGTAKSGGTWSNRQTLLTYDCQIENPYPEDCPMIVSGDCPNPDMCPEGDRRAANRQISCSVAQTWRWCDNDLFGNDVIWYCSPLPATPRHSPRLLYWWSLNVAGIVLGIIFELSLLMYTALRSVVMVSQAVGLRLIPLNNDRAFVAEMLVRAAFEMGDPKGEILGVQTELESGLDDRQRFQKLNTVFSAVWYKGKAVITGTVLKQICVRVTTYDTATWVKPYFGVTLATVVWDSMTCHSIMKDAETRAIGVTTSVEVFNQIIDTYAPRYESNPSSLSEKARLQLLRAIGVAVVKKGSMFPTMELMLRHALNYLGMKRNPMIAIGGVLDNEEDLIADMSFLSLQEARAVLCVFMLCCLLDGSVDSKEFTLWRALLQKVEEKSESENGGQRVTTMSTLACKVVCQRFRNCSPVTCDLLTACFDPVANKKLLKQILLPHRLLAFYSRQFFFGMVTFLVKGRL